MREPLDKRAGELVREVALLIGDASDSQLRFLPRAAIWRDNLGDGLLTLMVVPDSTINHSEL